MIHTKIAEALIQHPLNMLLSADSLFYFLRCSRQKFSCYDYIIPFGKIFQCSA